MLNATETNSLKNRDKQELTKQKIMFPFAVSKFTEDLNVLNVSDDDICKQLKDEELRGYVCRMKKILLFNSFAIEQVFNVLNSYEPLIRYFRKLEFDLRNYYDYLRESYGLKESIADDVIDKLFDEVGEDKKVDSKTTTLKTISPEKKAGNEVAKMLSPNHSNPTKQSPPLKKEAESKAQLPNPPIANESKISTT